MKWLLRPLGETAVLVFAVVVVLCLAASQAHGDAARPRDRWDFKFKGFVLGAWWGPGPTEAEVAAYADAGFNVVMCGRYMEDGNYGDPEAAAHELDLAHKYGLGVMFDTYTMNDRPWGGKAGPVEKHPTHHPASLIELQWLYKKFGDHPALVGFMIGDDQGRVSQRSAACTDFLFRQRPHLMPWLCGWIAPRDLAAHNNPICNPQIYPTLYNWGASPLDLVRAYCRTYASFARQCRREGIIFWPMFNVAAARGANPLGGYMPRDSLARFPAYAALAYGAEGIWYFTYNGGALIRPGSYTTRREVEAALTPQYWVARRTNRDIAAWGPRVLGATCEGLFSTAFASQQPDWPFPQDLAAQTSAEDCVEPAAGKLVEAMSDDLLVGVLSKPGQPPLAMIVDCRASKSFGDLPRRRVTVHFARAVETVRVLRGHRPGALTRRDLELSLRAGEGQMVELLGDEVADLAQRSAIYASPAPRGQVARVRTWLSEQDLAGLRAAKLRIDVFGSDSRKPFRDKFIYFNGHELAQAPGGGGDAWTTRVIDFAPQQLPWVKRVNQIVVKTRCRDAWKFRNLALAVQLTDGTWVRTSIAAEVHSSPGWAYTEGQAWGADGEAGPIELRFDAR
ncbi:MAG: hypothetical protein J7M26_07720 [Armatimonadetes bacterium]|nr:hypothetical protein [Armatimonadota bacterium]